MNLKSALKFLLKLGLSALAIFLILRKVDLEEALANLSSANLGFILLAFSFFFISKVISALRINALYRSRDMQVSQLLERETHLHGDVLQPLCSTCRRRGL